jgi:hypothetical protein
MVLNADVAKRENFSLAVSFICCVNNLTQSVSGTVEARVPPGRSPDRRTHASAVNKKAVAFAHRSRALEGSRLCARVYQS